MQQISVLNSNNNKNIGALSKVKAQKSGETQPIEPSKVFEKGSLLPYNVSGLVQIKANLQTQEEIRKYNEVVQILNNSQSAKSPQDGVPVAKKLDTLLKSGKLLNSSSNDKTSTLDNLHSILTKPRVLGFDAAKIAAQTIDTLYDPAIITQNFGDIPPDVKNAILNSDIASDDVKADPNLIDVEGSGTCVAASVEFHMANKHPAEFARWVDGLTGEKQEVNQNVNLSALSKNSLDAVTFLKLFETKTKNFNFDNVNLSLKPDDGAYIRAQVQDKHWDKGERSIVDVLIQSTLMQLGSQGSYDSLTDIRGGKFSTNPQGLVETEKTFIESIIENNEKLAIQYQNVDDNQNLIGWKCDFDKIQNHIIQNLNTGEDVIVGYVLTNETSGRTKELGYVNTPDNAPNKIINGHEITIVDYKQDKDGKITFICNDTDDDNPNLIEYSADYLIPKIHHAAYPVAIIEEDLKQIEANNAQNVA